MTEREILIIQKNNFNYIWNDLWKKTAKIKMYEKEYLISFNKYNIIFNKFQNDIFNFKPKYPISEWGFPKGKRNYLETDYECAKRECIEETTLNKSEIKILNKILPLVEILKGTNNINYKHVYFLSIIESKRNLYYENNIDEYIEVENIGWFKYNKIKYIIRPYHKEKKKILEELINFLAYNIYLEKYNDKIKNI
jgi:8-oxo-dGTP pyrophosphatase MutT (NUDIX family)